MEINDFESFFREVHGPGFTPFPWQNELIKRVVEKGWPEVIDLPTSAGKTAVIDIAIFYLALEADKPPKERQASTRIFFVVDRRIVVDEAYERSCRIRNRLIEAKDGTLAEVADRLKKLSHDNDSNPLDVIRLRGGMPLERAFIRNPLRPTIVLSTVDQVGSRLLFRGYGVSQIMRPIHAALVGIDSIVILDEAHLSRPFEETLGWVKHYQSESWAGKPIGKSIKMVRMTATPSSKSDDFFSPLDDPNCPDWDHQVLGPRLKCSKISELISIKCDTENPRATQDELVKTLAEKAASLMTKAHDMCSTPVVGIIANRVATARQVFNRLRSEQDSDTLLLTGRNRPYERDELVRNYLPRMKAGRSDADNSRPLYVVATQTVEVGADIDFDALITEAAALDALRQRFGRLNRLGKRDHANAVIVYVDYGRSKKIDPIYGEALAKTWTWMNKKAKKHKTIDFGIKAMKAELPTGENIADLITPRKCAPVLMPAHMDMLVQTNPQSSIEPEVAILLHGDNTEPEDVQIVWRADLPSSLVPNEDYIALEIVSVIPPTQLEALAIPFRAARAFLADAMREDINISDIEGENEEEPLAVEKSKYYAVKWRGADDSSLIRDPNNIKPGDILVVPSCYGGLDRFGWNPELNKPVRDIGDEAASKRFGKSLLRIHKNLISQWLEDETEVHDEVSGAIGDVLARFEDGEDLSDLSGNLIDELLNFPNIKPEIRERIEKLQGNMFETIYPETGIPQGILLQEKRNSPQELTDEDDSSSLSPEFHEVLLESHCRGVAELAKAFSSSSGLSNELVESLKIAGNLHDIGKADPRFQTWLWNGDKFATRKSNKILAKSSVPSDRNSRKIARKMAGYPEGTRHECYSTAMALQNDWLLNGTDKDLTLYLIGVHHGRGRPFMPSVDDNGCNIELEIDDKHLTFKGKHQLEKLDSAWPELFWRLNRCYGYWGLAYLETLLRLADQRRSEQGE
jgi:CRISPR-associated endonuclease/helicase Cas3